MSPVPSFNQGYVTGPALARYIMIGGFLGAGKTTALSKLAQRLSVQGQRLGLITNDQGQNLVDTAMLRSQGFATEEISGGCFCCRFDSLLEAAQKLNEQTRPDVFLAEPVGSCTDLVATVTYPLRRLYGRNFTVAPVSVLVDPIRARRALGLEPGGNFSDKVRYIYFKQIEEADLIVISKCDLLDEGELEALRHAMADRFPGQDILAVSARNGTGMDGWFDRITCQRQVARAVIEVDYEAYADGEARLGWLNATVQLSAQTPFDSEPFLNDLARGIQQRLQAAEAEVAHLKMTLSPSANPLGEIAAVNLVRNDLVPELSVRLEEPLCTGQMIINLRAEADPELLVSSVRDALASVAGQVPTLLAGLEHVEHFRPGKPMPTHRLQAVDLEAFLVP